MTSMNARIQRLEGQMNALAQAWLYLAATVEIQAGIDMERMEAVLSEKRWPNNPEIDEEARHTLQWLRRESSYARLIRRMRKPAALPLVETD